mgnify:FL=1
MMYFIGHDCEMANRLTAFCIYETYISGTPT